MTTFAQRAPRLHQRSESAKRTQTWASYERIPWRLGDTRLKNQTHFLNPILICVN
jgi:hypothetical protein